VDPQGRLNPEVIDLLLELADDFLDSVRILTCFTFFPTSCFIIYSNFPCI